MNNEEEEKKSTFYTGVGLIKNKKTPKPSIPSINKNASFYKQYYPYFQ